MFEETDVGDYCKDVLYDWREDDLGDMSRSLCPFCVQGGSPHDPKCEPKTRWNKTRGAYCLGYFPKDGETICSTCIHPTEDNDFCGTELSYLGSDEGYWCFGYEHRRF